MKRSEKLKDGLIVCLWACVMFAEELVRLALLRGAAPEDGLLHHVAFSLLYGGERAKLMLLLHFLILLALAALQLRGLQRAKRKFWLPALLLALFFTQNTLIYLSPTKKLLFLAAVPQVGLLENLLFWGTMTASFYSLILLFCTWMEKPLEKKEAQPFQRKRQLRWAGIIALCWLPILILRLPGSVYVDSSNQILQFQGDLPMDASHPFLLTWIYGALFTLGQRLAGDNVGLLFCMLFQAALGVYATSFACEELAAFTGRRWTGLGASLFFGLNVIYASFAQGVLKDAVYGPLFLLFVLFYCRVLRGGSRKDFLLLALLGILCGATRKAGIYITVLSLLGLLCRRELRRPVTVLCAVLVVGHGLLNWVIFPAAGVKSPEERENYSFFYQQTGYYCSTHPEWVTDQEREIISAVLDYDAVVRDYSPRTVDPLKNTYHAENAAQVRAFLLLNLKLACKHPFTALEGLVYSRNRYFCPFELEVEKVIGPAMGGFNWLISDRENTFDRWLPENSADQIEEKLWAFETAYPMRLLVLSGTYTYLTLLLLAAAMWQGDMRKKLLLLPVLLALGGLLLTHLNGAVRYAAPIIYTVPVLLVLCRGGRGSLEESHEA